MEHGIKGNLFSVAAIVSLSAATAVITCTVVIANTYRARLDNPKKMDQALQVTGSARKRIKADLAVWTVSVSGEGADLKASYAALKTATERVQSFLTQRKFPAEQIALNAISTATKFAENRFGDPTKEKAGYTMTRTFTVTSPSVEQAALAASEVTELVQDGLLVVSSPPDFYYTKIGELKREMIGEAAKDARTRADQIVSNAGCQIVEVRSARMGVLQITQPESTDVSGSGIYDTHTIDKDVTAVVSLSFGIGHM